jgi:hypothetical protein
MITYRYLQAGGPRPLASHCDPPYVRNSVRFKYASRCQAAGQGRVVSSPSTLKDRCRCHAHALTCLLGAVPLIAGRMANAHHVYPGALRNITPGVDNDRPLGEFEIHEFGMLGSDDEGAGRITGYR